MYNNEWIMQNILVIFFLLIQQNEAIRRFLYMNFNIVKLIFNLSFTIIFCKKY